MYSVNTFNNLITSLYFPNHTQLCIIAKCRGKKKKVQPFIGMFQSWPNSQIILAPDSTLSFLCVHHILMVAHSPFYS